ncbi:hypothetical protein ACFL45_08415 [Candidatus Neomarinimicrobiota bacterium]
MFTGLIIRESIPSDTILAELGLKIAKTEEWHIGERAAVFQPTTWNAIFIEGSEQEIDEIAGKLSQILLPRWYANISDAATEYVIFHEKIFKHIKGDKADAAEAISYGRSIGIPEHQLDWVR